VIKLLDKPEKLQVITNVEGTPVVMISTLIEELKNKLLTVILFMKERRIIKPCRQ